MDIITKTMILTLFNDAKWKERALSKLEILFDDSRNGNGIMEFNDELDEKLQYGKTYELIISIKEK